MPYRAGCLAVGLLAAASAPAILHSREAPGLVPDVVPPSVADRWTGTGLVPSPFALQWPASSSSTALVESRSPWDPLRRPAGAAGVQSASYPVDTGFVRVVPSVIVLPNPDAQAPGLIAVGVERAVAGDPLRWKGQLGWSGAASGSFEVDYRGTDRNVVIKGEERSALAARLPGGRAPGAMVETRWSERLDARTSASAALTSDRLALEGGGPSAASAGLELQHRPAERWSVRARLHGAAYSDAAADHRRGTLSLGTGFDAGVVGITATYRSEATLDGSGHGGRVALRGVAGDFRASGFADVQQRAGIVEVDLRNPTDLPRDFGELGLVGMRPEAAVQALRDRPALLHDHGLELGALRGDALRVQGGIDLSWRPSSGATQFGARVAYDGLDGPASPRRAVLGSLYTSWSVAGGAALTASYANWTLQDGADPEESRHLFRMSLRAPL